MLRHLSACAIITLFSLHIHAQDCQQADVPALRAIYEATGGADWTVQEGWGDPDDCTPCSWPRVTCREGRVTGLDFRDAGLVDAFPDVFDQLPLLEELYVSSGFQMRGALPPSLYAHNTLRLLSVEEVGLFSTFPQTIPGWQALETLIINRTAVRTELPDNLFQLPALAVLRLNDNSFAGPLPDPLNASASLSEVRLDNNNLSGCYPADLIAFSNQVGTLDLTGNTQLPWEGDWTQLLTDNEELGASCFLLSGLPGTIDEDCNCQSNFSFCEDLTTQFLLNLYTELGGDSWVNNDGWSQAVADQTCNYCDWYGISCNDNGQIATLDLSNNGLTGEIGPRTLNILVFDALDLSGNALTGQLNTTSALRSLDHFDVSDNQLTGPITFNNINTLTSAQSIDVSNNNFSGCLEDQLLTYCDNTFVTLDLSGNPLLPYEGDFTATCAAETQIGAPCRNEATDGPDEINEDCGCGLTGPPATTFTGQITTPVNATPIPAATISVAGTDGAGPPAVLSGTDGSFTLEPFAFTGISPSFTVFFPADLYRDASLGISTTDVLILQFHLLNIMPLDEVQLIAADLSGDGEVTVLDLLILQRIVLGLSVTQQAPDLDGGWWRYRVLPYEELPQSGGEPQTREVVIEAIKLGDLNFSY